jgi:hypothetical protein
MTTLKALASTLLASAMMTGPALADETIYGVAVCYENPHDCHPVTWYGMTPIDTVELCNRVKNRFQVGSPNAKFYCVQKSVATWSKVN